ncbi:MAG: GtrA family protein, partial [Solirubrobacteraceae bacterium]|nr:GtrA family protein [Solirubrobacteraceae bacterium]
RFAGVSGTGLALDYAIYTGLHLAGFPVTIANLISASCAVTFVYLASLRHVFHTRPTHRARPFTAYIAYQAIAVPAASIAVGLVEAVVAGQFILAKTLVVPFSFGANFLFMRWLLSPPTDPLETSDS